jgi:hypothetical protein
MKFGMHLITAWMSLFMILVLVSGALALALTDAMTDRLYGNKRIFFIILLLAYSVYRGFRAYNLFKQHKREEDQQV